MRDVYSKRFDVREKIIRFWVVEGELPNVEIEIEDAEDDAEEFDITFYPNQTFDIKYEKSFKFSNIIKTININNYSIRNPLKDKYNYESVKDYLKNKDKTNEQKIKYIFKMLKDYLNYYNVV